MKCSMPAVIRPIALSIRTRFRPCAAARCGAWVARHCLGMTPPAGEIDAPHLARIAERAGGDEIGYANADGRA